VNVKEEGVTEGDADNRNSVHHSEDSYYPGAETKSKKAMKGDDEVAAVPTADAHRQGQQHAFNWTQFAAAGKELDSHPQRQHCANRVTDEL
jgi:hypothetical protein